MNPAFVLLMAIALVSLWFLASGLYRLIGRFICKVGKDAIDQMSEEKEEKEKEDK